MNVTYSVYYGYSMTKLKQTGSVQKTYNSQVVLHHLREVTKLCPSAQGCSDNQNHGIYRPHGTYTLGAYQSSTVKMQIPSLSSLT